MSGLQRQNRHAKGANRSALSAPSVCKLDRTVRPLDTPSPGSSRPGKCRPSRTSSTPVCATSRPEGNVGFGSGGCQPAV